MPIKIPKPFPRRKSSGNELEDSQTPVQSSFRVLERPESKAFDGGKTANRLSYGRPLSQTVSTREVNPERDTYNRASGGTNHSYSSGGHDNSSSSARYSSTSTLPSSTEAAGEDRARHSQQYTMPAPPIPESTGLSLKAASRAFSFGRKKGDVATPPPPPARPPVPGHSYSDGFSPQATRGRAMTDNSLGSTSTTTPPKLLDTGLDFMKSDQDGFGSMFENFGKGNSQTDLSQNAGLAGNNIRHGEPSSPWQPEDPLMAASSPMERTFSYESDAPLSVVHPGLIKSSTMPLPNPTGDPVRPRQQRPPSDGLRRSSQYGTKSPLTQTQNRFQDDDARLVMDSINASRRLDRNSGAAYSDDDDPTVGLVSRPVKSPSPYNQSPQPSPQPPLLDSPYESQRQWGRNSASTTPRRQSALLATQEDQSLFDAIPGAINVRSTVSAPKQVQAPAKPQTKNKIMTPAEFERYRREQELKRTAEPRSNHDSSDGEDDYEDDDEVERGKQAARQRRKQEAHMSVYRQQMMKVTGEQPTDLPSFRPGINRASMSTPNLASSLGVPEINFDKRSENGKSSEDEDEDVPLGVLAAHGFPSKNRPPTAAGNNGSTIQYKSETYPPPSQAGSSSGASQSGRASGLPPFARNLPADPYYGASIVNSSNREPLAYGNQGLGSTHGVTPPGLHPAGLVGVINEEERARAARRGSPNSQGNYGSPPPPGMPQMMSPGEHATAQMTEQMSRMMQMQMQWMQQMQQMMAGGMMPGQPQLPPFAPQMPMQPGMHMQPGMPMSPSMTPSAGFMPRPSSTGSHPGSNIPGARPGQPRTMSMTGLGNPASWQPQQGHQHSSSQPMMSGGLGPDNGYANSIAPSERSNVGMPSRYRPVSIAPVDEQQRPRPGSRTSTFTEGTLHPGMASQSRLSTHADRSQSRLSTVRPVSTTPPRKPASDDDDEEGWEEMRKKRDKKKGMWRLNRKKDEVQAFDVYDYPEDQ